MSDYPGGPGRGNPATSQADLLVAQGRAAERAAIVAWLVQQYSQDVAVLNIARAIQAGCQSVPWSDDPFGTMGKQAD